MSPRTEPLVVPLYYDFASSLCYVAHRVLERLAEPIAELGVALEWRPLDLTRLTHWRRGAPMTEVGRANTQRVSEELGVPVRVPERWLDSRPALCAALAIEDPARGATWRERIFCAAFEQDLDIGAPGAVERWLEELGLALEPRELLRRRTQLELETELARDAQVQGVPTFLFDAWPLGGIQDDRTTLHMLGRFVARKRSESGGAAASRPR